MENNKLVSHEQKESDIIITANGTKKGAPLKPEKLEKQKYHCKLCNAESDKYICRDCDMRLREFNKTQSYDLKQLVRRCGWSILNVLEMLDCEVKNWKKGAKKDQSS